MEEQTALSEDYKKWFNRGYELRKTMPGIFKDISMPTDQSNEKTQAFEAGRKQFEKEYGLDKARDDFREKMRDQLKNKGHNKDRGK